jgi:phosphoribosylaminoimidazole-succinocarboxamide synthase
MAEQVLLKPDLPGLKHVTSGKVRDMYDLGDQLLIVTSDRLSAFDVVMPTGIPYKGKVLNRLSEFWFNFLGVSHHMITCDVDKMPAEVKKHKDVLRDRAMLVKKAEPFPVECVARGYLIGSGWKDYQASGAVCGITLPKGLQQASKLEKPIFTPRRKPSRATTRTSASTRPPRRWGRIPPRSCATSPCPSTARGPRMPRPRA